ncbi:MAG: DUF2147 domain-containing protein [Alysiella sp.]|uniref:DUF2147 domain-containing protein n=1 Tax=Alysiella sp. TaxID=1872483 RepID=UPI0026DA78A2|nr:DUF2147 domain-containing protein [Alysiella sp.]MDO4432994.1 DUF2147 domain-containing protein [Alysiella sp.]
MNKIIFTTLITTISAFSISANIEGKWQTIDDTSKKPKAIVSIEKEGNHYVGTIVQLSEGVPASCAQCAYTQPLIGLRVLTDLKQKNEHSYTDGKIFDPKGGETYKAKATLSKDGKILEVRGFVGISLFGRTQEWKRIP